MPEGWKPRVPTIWVMARLVLAMLDFPLHGDVDMNVEVREDGDVDVVFERDSSVIKLISRGTRVELWQDTFGLVIDDMFQVPYTTISKRFLGPACGLFLSKGLESATFKQLASAIFTNFVAQICA